MNRSTEGSANFPIPVTCLHQLDCAGVRILLVGTGGVLGAINLHDFSPLCESGPLLTQTIRCIVPVTSDHHEDTNFTCGLLVQGGSQIAWVELCIEISSASILNAHFKTVHKYCLDYWIICGRPSNSQGIAATFLTSYNILYQVKVNAYTQTLDWHRLNDKLTTFLYSGDLKEINDCHYLVTSGTALGKVLVWSCMFDEHQRKCTTRPLREFSGHQGSVFGVSISSQFLISGKARRIIASCSDDRTIRIWDVSDAILDEQKYLEDTDLHDQAEEDTPKTFETELTRTWAHASRIWNVDLVSANCFTPSHSSIGLISNGEDATAQSWSLDLDNLWQSSLPKKQVWEHRYVDNHHSGKNIWSRCYTNDENEVALYTGGADGQIVVRSYSNTGRADRSAIRSSQKFKEISFAFEDNSRPPTLERKPVVLKSYIIFTSNNLLATTDDGYLLKGVLRERAFVWQLLLMGSKGTPFVLCRRLSAGVAFFVDVSDNLLMSYDTTTTRINSLCKVRHAKVAAIEVAWSEGDLAIQGPRTCLAVSYFGSTELDLVWIERGKDSLTTVSQSSVRLPQTFEVTSTCYDPDTELFLAGSRAGAIAVHTNALSTAFATVAACYRGHIHGSDTVTSIQRLCEDNSDTRSEPFYLTTGRDGTYCVIQIVLALPPRIRIVHQSTPPLGPNIEGAQLVRRAEIFKRIVLHGFQSTKFVVWDESYQTQVMSVDCGGAHRNWAFSCNDETGHDNTFVWTKASTLMYHQQAEADHKIIRSGGHGREIKALAVAHIDKQRTLIATGSEDTNIRIFELSNCNTNDRQLKCLAVLRRHTTGLQDLKFSSKGDFLLSAAGMEELCAWKLTAVPVIKQGVCFAGALQKHDALSDARIMSIDVRDVVCQAASVRYILVGAFSNGKLKVIEYTTSIHGGEIGLFTVVNQLDCGTICLTQAQFLSSPSGGQSTTIVAGTNGSVRMCHTGNILGSSYRSEAPNIGSTAHGIHQNSVTALQAVNLTSSIQVLITGGDDNALAISLCEVSPPTVDMADMTKFKTLIIPKAHAAALTALAIFDLDSDHEPHPNPRRTFVVFTAGNDQRVKAWRLKIDLQRYASAPHEERQQGDAMEYIEIEQIEDVHTNVADVSEVEILRRTSHSAAFKDNAEGHKGTQAGCVKAEVLVVGVGMEAVNLEIPCSLT